MIKLKCSSLQNGILYVLSMSVHLLGMLLENWCVFCILWLIVQPDKINDAGRNVSSICFESSALVDRAQGDLIVTQRFGM